MKEKTQEILAKTFIVIFFTYLFGVVIYQFIDVYNTEYVGHWKWIEYALLTVITIALVSSAKYAIKTFKEEKK